MKLAKEAKALYKPRKAGRPKADVTKAKVVSVRMKPEDYDKLKAYADSSKMTVTEVMQKDVSIILDEEKH